MLALAWRRRSIALAIAAAFLLSPIVWRHYFVLLAVPLAISFPRLHPAWAIPLGLWLVPGTYNGGTWQVALALAVGAATVVAAEVGGGPDMTAPRMDRPSASGLRSLRPSHYGSGR